MTNIDDITMTQATRSGRDLPMQNWIDYNQAMVKARIEPLEAEAAAQRLAANGMSAWPRRQGLRGLLGRTLIRAGEAIAPEPVRHHHHHHAEHRPSATA
jgi:hypothetical protein